MEGGDQTGKRLIRRLGLGRFRLLGVALPVITGAFLGLVFLIFLLLGRN